MKNFRISDNFPILHHRVNEGMGLYLWARFFLLCKNLLEIHSLMLYIATIIIFQKGCWVMSMRRKIFRFQGCMYLTVYFIPQKRMKHIVHSFTFLKEKFFGYISKIYYRKSPTRCDAIFLSYIKSIIYGYDGVIITKCM